MNRYFISSCMLHAVAAFGFLWVAGAAVQETKATYTIDFIGSGKVIAMQQAATKAAAPAPETKKVETPLPEEKPVEKSEPAAKPDKKAYDSKTEISAQKQPKKKETPKAAPLAAPSILDENPTAEETASNTSGEGEFEGGNIQTDFATFPYPWYITQVRNSLWSEWEKRRPVGTVLRAMVSFAIARDGKIKDLKAVKSSGDDSFDFAAKSAVINAGPFPPLPMLYEKDELTVTVEFKQEK